MPRFASEKSRPQDCALAVCIPTTLSEFEADSAGGTSWDFAQSILRSYEGYDSRNVWRAIVQPTMDAVRKTLDRVAQLGVNVHARSSLSDLQGLCRASRVVTVLTHWRSGELFRDHVRDPDLLSRCLQSDHGRVAQAFRTSCCKRGIRVPCGGSPAEFADAFCETGNNILINADLGPSSYPQSWHVSSLDAYRVHANRSVMDQEFASGIVPGNRAEFADGMHTVRVFAEAVPAEFDGVLDLTMCNSVMACEEIKLYRRLTCVGNERKAPLALRAEIYAETIQVLNETETSYVDASRDLREAMSEELARRGY